MFPYTGGLLAFVPRDGRDGNLALFPRKVAVPGANGRPLRDGPLLRRLPAGAHDPPHVFPPAGRPHGFKVHIMAAAGKTGTYGMGI